MERKKTNEVYILHFDDAVKAGQSWSTRGTSFFWEDVVKVTESTLIRNCTVVKTTYDEFTINEHYELVDGEWKAFLDRKKLGITQPNE